MPRRYQDVYPSSPLLDSAAQARPSAAELLTLEYFEAEAGEMAEEVFTQHHLLLNLRERPQRVENWRDGVHREILFGPGEIVVTPAGVRSGWRWHGRSKVIVITLEPDRFRRFAENEVGVLLTEAQLQNRPQFPTPISAMPRSSCAMSWSKTRPARSWFTNLWPGSFLSS